MAVVLNCIGIYRTTKRYFLDQEMEILGYGASIEKVKYWKNLRAFLVPTVDGCGELLLNIREKSSPAALTILSNIGIYLMKNLQKSGP